MNIFFACSKFWRDLWTTTFGSFLFIFSSLFFTISTWLLLDVIRNISLTYIRRINIVHFVHMRRDIMSYDYVHPLLKKIYIPIDLHYLPHIWNYETIRNWILLTVGKNQLVCLLLLHCKTVVIEENAPLCVVSISWTY